jgi:hypothetical protein
MHPRSFIIYLGGKSNFAGIAFANSGFAGDSVRQGVCEGRPHPYV